MQIIERVQYFNQVVCDFAHAFCDNLDISGDPVVDSNNRQVDDCDGQPNFC